MAVTRICRGGNLPGQRLSVPAMILVIVLLWSWAGCGDDIEIFQPPKDQGPYLQQTSPENVLHNLATSYSTRDYNQIVPLFRDDFTFVFTLEDAGAPGVPRDGFWGRADELQATRHMLDPDYVPDESKYKVAGIEMILALSSSLQETDLEGAPHGTLKGRANLDMTITLDDGVSKLLVRSRPLFYFSPDGSGTFSVWRLWRCDDAPFDDDLSGLGGFSLPSDVPDGSAAAIHEPVRRIEPAAEMGTPSSSWGAVKAVYR